MPVLAPLTTKDPSLEQPPQHNPPVANKKLTVTSKVLEMEIFTNENQDELPQTVNIESVECSPERRDTIEDNKNSVISKNLPGTNQQSRNLSLNRTRTNIKVVTGSEFLESKGPMTNSTLDLKPRKVSFQVALSVEDQSL